MWPLYQFALGVEGASDELFLHFAHEEKKEGDMDKRGEKFFTEYII